MDTANPLHLTPKAWCAGRIIRLTASTINAMVPRPHLPALWLTFDTARVCRMLRGDDQAQSSPEATPVHHSGTTRGVSHPEPGDGEYCCRQPQALMVLL
jgi:hypothetical protein